MWVTVVAKAITDADGERADDRRHRHGHRATLDQLGARRRLGNRTPRRSPSRSSAPGHAPRPAAQRGHHRRDGDTCAGNGTYHSSAGYTPTAAGDYWWYASYGGDTNNNTAPRPVARACPRPSSPRSSPTVTATGPRRPARSTPPYATTAITSTLAPPAPASNASGTITFKVFGPQRRAPTTCTTGRTTVGPDHRLGQRHLQPDGRLHPDTRRRLLVVRLLRRRLQQQHRSPHLWLGTCPRPWSPSATPTRHHLRPSDWERRHRHRAGSVQLGARVTRIGVSSPTGTITFTVFGPQATAPTTCTSGGTTVGTATVTGNSTYNPTAGFNPTTAGDYWWYASYGGDTNNNTAPPPVARACPRPSVAKASPTLTAAGPGTGTAGTAITAWSVSSALAGARPAPTRPARSPSRSSAPRQARPPPAPRGGTTVGTG